MAYYYIAFPLPGSGIGQLDKWRHADLVDYGSLATHNCYVDQVDEYVNVHEQNLRDLLAGTSAQLEQLFARCARAPGRVLQHSDM